MSRKRGAVVGVGANLREISQAKWKIIPQLNKRIYLQRYAVSIAGLKDGIRPMTEVNEPAIFG
jgi:predicted component of type VI protein secretion system